MYLLIFRDKAEVIKECYIKKKTISIGSDPDSDICIVHKMVSPKHCEVTELDNNKIRVTDLKSTFGVFVNKKRVNSADINYGDTLGIGPFELDFFRAQGADEWSALLCIAGKLRGRKFLLLKDATKLGRDPALNDIVITELEDTQTSRRHATITKTPKGYFLSDKRSKNRTRVNTGTVGEEEELLLKLNDEIVIGKHIFRFARLTETRIRPPSKIYPLPLRLARVLLVPLLLSAIFLVSFFFLWTGFNNIVLLKNRPQEVQFKVSQLIQRIPFAGQETGRSAYTAVTGAAGAGDLYRNTLLESLGRILRKKISKPAAPDLLFASNTGEAFSWNRAGGLGKAYKEAYPCASAPAYADFNKDGVPETVLHSADSRLYVIDGRHGDILFKSEFLGQQLYSSPLVYTDPKSGACDVITCTGNGMINFIYRPLTGGKTTAVKADSAFLSSPVLLPAGGRPQVTAVSSSGRLYVCDEKTGKVNKDVGLREAAADALKSEVESMTVSATPAVGDVNGDGDPEIVIVTDEEMVLAVNARTGRLAWKPYQIDPAGEKLQAFPHPSCVLAGVSGRGGLDIIALSTKGKVYGIDGATGEAVLTFDAGNQRLIASPALADLAKDGRKEVIFTTENGELYALNFDLQHKDNLVLFYEKISNKPVTVPPAVGDIEGDGLTGILATSSDNSVRLIKTNVRCFRDQILWPGFKRGGTYSDSNGKLLLLSISSVAGALAYIALFVSILAFRKSRRRIPWIG